MYGKESISLELIYYEYISFQKSSWNQNARYP